MHKLGREFFIKDVLDVAPKLLGSIVVLNNGNEQRQYCITEVEAYRGEEDLACHASKGRTARTEIMYHLGGHVYVYLIYGMYWMLNIVTGYKDNPQAVLIRGVKECSGPGRVGKLLNVDKSFYGVDLVKSKRIWLVNGLDVLPSDIIAKPRIGIDYAGEEWANKNWRYILSI